MPTLWIGTSLGSVQTVVFNTPAVSERHAHPVVVSTCSKRILLYLVLLFYFVISSFVTICDLTCVLYFVDGSTFKLKGCILSMSFLDCNGALIPYLYESWKDENTDGKERNSRLYFLY